MKQNLKKLNFHMLEEPPQDRSYYILSLLQERELLRAKVHMDNDDRVAVSSAACTMAAALIEELLENMEEQTHN